MYEEKQVTTKAQHGEKYINQSWPWLDIKSTTHQPSFHWVFCVFVSFFRTWFLLLQKRGFGSSLKMSFFWQTAFVILRILLFSLTVGVFFFSGKYNAAGVFSCGIVWAVGYVLTCVHMCSGVNEKTCLFLLARALKFSLFHALSKCGKSVSLSLANSLPWLETMDLSTCKFLADSKLGPEKRKALPTKLTNIGDFQKDFNANYFWKSHVKPGWQLWDEEIQTHLASASHR